MAGRNPSPADLLPELLQLDVVFGEVEAACAAAVGVVGRREDGDGLNLVVVGLDGDPMVFVEGTVQLDVLAAPVEVRAGGSLYVQILTCPGLAGGVVGHVQADGQGALVADLAESAAAQAEDRGEQGEPRVHGGSGAGGLQR